MNAKNWRQTVAKGVTVAKPVDAAQIALYQAYMEAMVPGISASPALFTAINKDTAELQHELVPFDADLAQRMSDCGVRILRETDAGELLPRIAANRDFFEWRFCPWAERCWGLPTCPRKGGAGRARSPVHPSAMPAPPRPASRIRSRNSAPATPASVSAEEPGARHPSVRRPLDAPS